MEIKNSYKPDESLYKELKSQDPAEVCRRALCSWDQARGCFELEVWGHLYDTFPELFEIKPRSADSPPVNTAISLAVMYYLLRVRDLPRKGEWISEKDIPGGEQFFRGPHAIPGRKIAEVFGDNLDGFRARCEELGGEPLDMGDASYCFRFLPRVQVAVVLWRGDEEFDAEAGLLFDRTVGDHLPLDVIFALASEICLRISAENGAILQRTKRSLALGI